MNTAVTQTRVAVIGLGNIGKAVATNLIKGNQPVILASRDSEKTKALTGQLGSLATSKEIADAIQSADVVIPAIFFNALKDFFQAYSKELEGKIIVDVSNPIAPDGNGGFKKIIGEQESAGKILSNLLPKNAKLVKAFGTLGVHSLVREAFNEFDKKVLFYASDSTNSNQQIEQLIISSGFVPFHVGGLDQSIHIEVFGDLHEFGKLGKTVTLKEVKINNTSPLVNTTMKSLIISVFFLLAFAACQNETKNQSNRPTQTQMEQSTEKSAIEKLLFSYRDALNASEVNSVLQLYATDGVFMPSNAPSAVGHDQVKASYEFVFSQIQLSIEFYIDEIVINGDMAFARTTSKGTTLIHANGQTMAEENRELFVLQKTNGQWKISRYMFNKMK